MRPGSHTKTLTLALAGAVLALLLAVPAAFGDVLTPDSGPSPNAEDIDTLYKIVFYLGLVVFVGVEGALIWSLVKYRARRGGPPGQQIRGNTPLEIGWTAGAAVVVILIIAVTFVFLDDIQDPAPSLPGGLQTAQLAPGQPPGGEALEIDVNGQQYIWRYDYPGGGPNEEGQLFSYHEMVVPVDTTVILSITSQDVAHSWWIPELGGKADAIPGHVNETWFRISEPGVYEGQCAELCGDNHADMRAEVRAVPVAEFEAWAEERRREIREAQQALAEQRQEREREQQQ